VPVTHGQHLLVLTFKVCVATMIDRATAVREAVRAEIAEAEAELGAADGADVAELDDFGRGGEGGGDGGGGGGELEVAFGQNEDGRDNGLPPTATVLVSPEGIRVVLLGSTHVSFSSVR
jgi:hypothetical protein